MLEKIKLLIALMFLASSLTFAFSANANQVEIVINQPAIDEAPYHKPYVAVWIETLERQHVATVALWYEQKSGSEKWLKDIRQWWRKAGRAQSTEEIDAYSGATRSPKRYKLVWDGKDQSGKALPKGKYLINVEAVREHGGRSYLRSQIDTRKAGTLTLEKEAEIGPVEVKWD